MLSISLAQPSVFCLTTRLSHYKERPKKEIEIGYNFLRGKDKNILIEVMLVKVN